MSYSTSTWRCAIRARLLERLDTYAACLRPLVKEGDVWLFEIVGFPN